jgi:hypothetical protein
MNPTDDRFADFETIEPAPAWINDALNLLAAWTNKHPGLRDGARIIAGQLGWIETEAPPPRFMVGVDEGAAGGPVLAVAIAGGTGRSMVFRYAAGRFVRLTWYEGRDIKETRAALMISPPAVRNGFAWTLRLRHPEDSTR